MSVSSYTDDGRDADDSVKGVLPGFKVSTLLYNVEVSNITAWGSYATETRSNLVFALKHLQREIDKKIEEITTT